MKIVDVGVTIKGHKFFTFNEGGRWLGVLWILKRELIVILNIWCFLFGVHWYVEWGWFPRIAFGKHGGDFINRLASKP